MGIYDINNIGESDQGRVFFFGAQGEISRNTLDKFIYPTRGSDLRYSLIYVSGANRFKSSTQNVFSSGANQRWFGSRLQWTKVFDMPSLDNFSFGLHFDGVYTNHPEMESEATTIMSSPLYAPVPHANMIYMPDFRAARYLAVGVMPTFEIIDNLMVRAGFYAMLRDKNHTASHWHQIADISLVYHTPIGPVSLALTKYDMTSWKNTYLSFNFGLLIFSPKALFY